MCERFSSFLDPEIVITSITSGLTVSLLFHHSARRQPTLLTYFLLVSMLVADRTGKIHKSRGLVHSVVTVLVSSSRDVTCSPPLPFCCSFIHLWLYGKPAVVLAEKLSLPHIDWFWSPCELSVYFETTGSPISCKHLLNIDFGDLIFL